MARYARPLTNLRMRTTPEILDWNTIKTLEDVDLLKLLGNVGRWLYIEHHGMRGYVGGRFARCLEPANGGGDDIAWVTRATGEITVYAARSTQAEKRGAIPEKGRIEVVGFDRDDDRLWLEVDAGGGLAGFVDADNTWSDIPPLPDPQLEELMSLPVLELPEMRQAREMIAGIANDQLRGDLYETLQCKVPYHSQRDNQATEDGVHIEVHTGRMCNLTSLAMCLEYLGIANPDPEKQFEDVLEEIRQEKNLPDRTWASGWGGTAKVLGAEAVFLLYSPGGFTDQEWYEGHVTPVLRDGFPVMMSIRGHIVRLQAVTDEGLVVDDPFGRCRLKAGNEEAKWEYYQTNAYGKPGETIGADMLWQWEEVEAHGMGWVAKIAPMQLGVGVPLAELPAAGVPPQPDDAKLLG